MHLYTSDERHAWFHSFGPVDLKGARRNESDTIQNEKFLSTVGFVPTTLRFEVWCFTDWANRAWWKLYYCGWLQFRGIQIVVVSVEGTIHEFQYPWNGNYLYKLRKKILWPRILNPTNVSFLFNPRKVVPTQIKPSKIFKWPL